MDSGKREELLTILSQQVTKLRSSEGWQHWLSVAARFRSYSLRNQLLIAAQRPDATWVAGYRTWQALGRHVRRGERGIAILAPLIRRVIDQQHNTTTDGAPETTAIISGFKVVHVFDINQTDGDDLPIPMMPDVEVPDDTLLDRLITTAQAVGYTVEYVNDADNGARGWYDPTTRTITLVSTYPHSSRTRTILHELAHAHDTFEPDDTRAVRELVAESAAYIVGTGVFTISMDDASALYSTVWGASTEMLQRLAQRVHRVAHAVEMLVSNAASVTP
ncbi:MAG: hypothetical protein JOZ99_02895 [Actinobacteria bacterium]|nr:hypothetical protein [Actinomycetota bacterium]